jgi:hypothetical protein
MLPKYSSNGQNTQTILSHIKQKNDNNNNNMRLQSLISNMSQYFDKENKTGSKEEKMMKKYDQLYILSQLESLRESTGCASTANMVVQRILEKFDTSNIKNKEIVNDIGTSIKSQVTI